MNINQQSLKQQRLHKKIQSMQSRALRKKIRNAILIFSAFTLLTFSLSACCVKNSDGSQTCTAGCSSTVSGYALFGSGTSPTAGNYINLQWSDDQFSSHVYTGTNVHNAQGLLAVPFEFEAYYECAKTPQIQIRAYESGPGAVDWQLGDVVGRYDGTTGGNGAYRTVAASAASDVLIYMDGTGAQ